MSNYVTKSGFLTSEDSSVVTPATLIIYNNGVSIVEWAYTKFSVTRRNDGQYDLNGPTPYGFVHFIIT